MNKFFEVAGYIQRVTEKGEITCTCMWSTLELSRHPKNPEKRKDCKHIKMIKSWDTYKNEFNRKKEKTTK